MKRIVFFVLVCVSALVFSGLSGFAQTKLIDYWHFNTFTSVIHLPATANLLADYTTITSPTAALVYKPLPAGVSGTYLGYCDFGASGTSDYDTVNSQFATVGGNYFRARNPTDSMQLLLYIPTTNYQNINIRYGTETSSTTSGDSVQLYSYSIDSGVTWLTAGLSIPFLNVNSTAYTSFGAANVAITDPLAWNNPKFVFRITFKGHNTGTSGNNRFDNITVKGDTLITSGPGSPGSLIYFWHFNNFTGSYLNPNFPYIAPDYFIHDSSKAKVHMGLFPGTSVANPTYFDVVTFATGDADTVNNSWPAYPSLLTVAGGNGIRPRNPCDSVYLYYYMPTVNYKNIVLTYGSETSSFTSGDSCQVFSYSVDSGATWRISGLSKLTDSALTTVKRISVSFTDPDVNNCSKLVFRIRFKGRNTGTSGNNRFDNISVQGDSIFSPAPTIITTPVALGSYCNTASSPISIAYTTTGAVSGPYSVQISNSNGVFPTNFTSNIIGTGTTSPISAIIPAGSAPGTTYRVRVVSSYPGIYGTDNGTDFTLAGVAAPISGPSVVCANGATINLIETGGGTWSSTNPAIATIGTTGIVTGVAPGVDTITFSVGSGCTTSTTITVNPVPAPITGLANECTGVSVTLSDITPSGVWSSTTTTVATIGSSTGVVSPLTVGTSLVKYTGTNGCFASVTVTVNPLPSAISGATPVCVGSSFTLTDAGGGTWTSSNTSLATVGSSTGVVNGISAGSPVITYTLPTGCLITTPVVINPNPTAITGSATGCVGATTAFSDATAFGAWTSSNTAVATVGSSTGIVTGTGTGVATISYTLSTGCQTTTSITINAASSPVTGASVICAGANTTLSNSSPGGTWSSSNTAVATVGIGVSSSTTVTGIVGGVVTITYTLPTGCMATKAMTINALPAPIAGLSSLYCLPSSTTLTDATPGGTWSSATTSVATVGTGSGLVTGVAPGTTTISYTLPTGCSVSLVETVYPTPAPITGNANACVGATANYTDVTAFGAWSSSNTSIATIGSGTGIATGIATGTVTISYSVSTGCVITKNITVNPVPTPIYGVASVCASGSVTTLFDTSTGGIWSSSVASLASINPLTGVVTGVAAGNPVITYTLPTGCMATAPFTVNPLPAPIGGVTSVYCIGSTALLADFVPGGTWSSSNPAVATIDVSGLVTGVSAGSSTISYVLPTGCYVTYVENITSTPAPITGAATTCISTTTTFSDLTAFGAWSSSNTSVADIGSGTGVVTGMSAGTATITYELSPSCLITREVTVNPQPLPISGITQVCIGSTTTLSDAGGGTWSSSIPALASVVSGTGVVSGVVAGTVSISYTLPTGCVTSTGLTVNPLPVISGQLSICLGLPSPLVGNIPGGTWSSSNTAVATIGSSSGLISGVTLGTTTITYTLPTGCLSTVVVSVNPPPAPITGTTHVCIGLTTTLSGIGGGGWYSSDPSVASVGFGTGLVSGNSVGTATITYSLGTSCISTAVMTVNPLPAAISGTTTVCQGDITLLSDVTSGGSWASSNTSVAVIGTASGVTLGVSGGTSSITYTVTSTGCISITTINVNPIAPVTGSTQVCAGYSIPLSNAIAGGSWTSGTPSVAIINATSGLLTGVSAGTVNITYTLPTGCISTTTITVNANPAPIAGNDNVCIGSTYAFTDATSGGTWSSTNFSVATVGPVTGSVTGSTLGTTTISYTLPTGCAVASFVTIDPLPAAITGTAQVCLGLNTTLSDATSGGIWSSSSLTLAVVGSGTGVVTGASVGAPAITYTLPTGCYITTSFVVKPLPVAYTVTGGGAYCSGASGLHIGLSNSDTTISYQLYRGGVAVGSAVTGTGTALDFGLQTAAGVYTVTGTNALTTCVNNMTGNQTISTIPLPNAYPVTGGGGHCISDTGVHVYLGNSDSGIHYQLMLGTATVGLPLIGTGSSLDFGLNTTPGIYRVVAINPVTTCTRNMFDSAVIFIDTVFTPTVTISVNPTGVLWVGSYDTLTAHVTGGGPSVSYQWVNNVTFIAGATTAVYIANNFYNQDSITVFVKTTSSCGTVITPKSIILRIHDDAVPSINMEAGDLKLIPNPNKGLFIIRGTIGTSFEGNVNLEITNMLGQSVFSDIVKVQNGALDKEIQLNSNLANGMYLLNVQAGNERKVFHFVMEK